MDARLSTSASAGVFLSLRACFSKGSRAMLGGLVYDESNCI
jgi:hypothetical protein